MKNHIIRRRLSFYQKLSSNIESLAFSVIPDDELISEDQAYTDFSAACQKNGEKRPIRRTFANAIDGLKEKGYIKVVEGETLEKFLVVA